MDTIVTAIFFIYGLVFGSFFNVVGLRVPNGTLLAQTRSYCDTCQRILTWKELIPVWSFVRQSGRCRECKEKISVLYPIMELATGLLAAMTFYRYGWSGQTVLGLLLLALIVPITVSDLAYRKIPNKLLLFFFRQRLFPNFFQKTVLQFSELPVLRIGKDFNLNRNLICRWTNHQRFAPLVHTILNET